MKDPILDLSTATRSAQRWLAAMVGASAMVPLAFLTYDDVLRRKATGPAIAHAMFIPLFFLAAAGAVRFRAKWPRIACWFGGLFLAWTIYVIAGNQLAIWLAGPYDHAACVRESSFGALIREVEERTGYRFFGDLPRYGESALHSNLFFWAAVFLAIAFVPVNAAVTRTHQPRLSTLWTSISVIAWTSLAWSLGLLLLAATSQHTLYLAFPLPALFLAVAGFVRLHLERVRMRHFLRALRDDLHPSCGLAIAHDEANGAPPTRAILYMSSNDLQSPRMAVVRMVSGPHAYRSQARETVASILLV